MSKGVLHGVGTGPGDPELLTIKAVRTIESCPVIAAPQTADGAMVALDIVRGAVDFTGKTVIPVRFSMTRDLERRAAEHASLVRELVAHLDAARDVALLNLGDPSIYATFQRIAPDVRAHGFEARAIPGVPSFCAVAAALERDLTPEMSSPLHIVPGGYDDVRRAIGWPGTKVVMKARRSLADTKRILREEGAFDGAELVEDCGLPGERVYRSLDKEHVLLATAGFDKDHRQMPGYNAAKARTFSDARVTFTEEQVKKECARCLGCGATKVDSYLCIGCGLCTTKCKFDAIHLKKVRDWHAGSYETMPIKVAEGVVKRAGSIVKKAVRK